MKAVGISPSSNFSPPTPVMFRRAWGLSESRGSTATPSFLKNSFAGRHVQEGMGFVGVAEHDGDAFLLEEFVARTAQGNHIRKRRWSRRLSFGRRRRLHGAKDGCVLIFRVRRGERLRLLVNDDRALELALEPGEIVLCFRVKIHDGTTHGSVCAGRPSG